MKSYAICQVKSLEGDGPNGAFEAILSAPTLDRDGEVIDPKAFEPLPERITIDIDHGMTVATTVGSGQPYYDGDVLKIKGAFSSIPRAQELRTLVTEGHVDRMSVTFMDAERSTKDGVPHVTRAELLNAAFVPIPSNREAAVLVAKAFALDPAEKAGARNSSKDAERLQSIHDLTVENGAICDGEKSHTQTPDPAIQAGPVTDPETAPPVPAPAPAGAAKSSADVTRPVVARAQAEAASVL